MKRSLFELAAVACIFPVFLLAGCSSSFAPGPVTPTQTPLGAISGTVYGGQQPILGATVTAFETSNTAYGGASYAIDTTTTDMTTGFFSFPASDTCDEGTVVYLYSVGGKPVAGQAANSAAGLMAVVGTCPGGADSLVGAAGGGAVQIYMNEVSTVAAAYALAGFAINSSNASTDATHIGAATAATRTGAVTDTLAQTGIQNAGANAAQMYTVVATQDNAGGSGAVRKALTTTPAGNGVVPYKLINTLANILAACINSSGSSSSACTTLFNDARSGGGQSGTQATDTATAAIYIAQHPYSNQVTNIYNIVGGAFGPIGTSSSDVLTSAPTSFLVELIFTGGGLLESTQSTLSYPQTTAVDGSGNIWVANDDGNDVSKFSPLGVSQAGTTGFYDSTCGINGTEANLQGLTTVAIDNSGNAWIGINGSNKVCVMSSNGTNIAYITAGTEDAEGGGSYYDDGPFGIAIDASGNGWVTDDAGDDQGGATSNTHVGQLVEITPGSTYTPSTKASGSTNGLNGPLGIAIQAANYSGDIWVSNFAENQNDTAGPDSVFSSTGGTIGNYTAGSISYGAPIAIDSNGYVWTGDVGDSPQAISKTKGDGSSGISYSSSSLNSVIGLCIDGAGNVWASSQGAHKALLELKNDDATLLSPTTGYVPATDSGNQYAPGDPVVDLSGNVWYQILGGSTLRELVGASVPVATPLAYGVANSKLGTRP